MRVSTILFEHNYLPLLHFEEVLRLEHVDLFAPKSWGFGRTDEIDCLCKKRHVVKNVFELDCSVDAIVINDPVFNKYDDKCDVDRIISSCFYHVSSASVLDLRNKYNECSFASQANNVNNQCYVYDIYDSSIITDKPRAKKVFVFSSAEGDVTSLYSQLSLFEFLTGEKKKAVIVPSSKIISPNKRVVNFDWSLYRRLPLDDFHGELKQFIEKVKFADADYLILGIPEIVMNIDRRRGKGFGVIHLLLSQLLKIDAMVINLPGGGFSEAALKDVRELMMRRYECGEVYIVNSNVLYREDDNETSIPTFLSREALVTSGAQNYADGVHSFSIFDELEGKAFSKAAAGGS